RRRKAILRADLAPQQRHAPAESHRADSQFVGVLGDIFLQLRQLGDRIDVVRFAEELSLGGVITARPIAADANAQVARGAALSLRLIDGVHQALADAVEVAIGASQPGELLRQRILDVLVFASPPFEQQLDFDLVLAVLMEVKYGSAGAEVVTAVLS